jgi:Ca2+-binding EF-hand superfamily protein
VAVTAEPNDSALRDAFRRADTDHDDLLDLVGFTVVLEELGLHWDRQQIQHRFETADSNRDGLISYAEIQTLPGLHRSGA